MLVAIRGRVRNRNFRLGHRPYYMPEPNADAAKSLNLAADFTCPQEPVPGGQTPRHQGPLGPDRVSENTAELYPYRVRASLDTRPHR